MAHPKSYSAEIVNALLRKQVRGYDDSGGNLLRIGVAWNQSGKGILHEDTMRNGYLEIVGFAFYMGCIGNSRIYFFLINGINSGSSQSAAIDTSSRRFRQDRGRR